MKKGDKFRKLSATAREHYAVTALDAEAILAEAAKTAALGEHVHAVIFDRPVDLPRTEAAKTLKATLSEHGFDVEWQKRTILTGGFEKTAWTLVVRW